jgi:hypothetical protein
MDMDTARDVPLPVAVRARVGKMRFARVLKFDDGRLFLVLVQIADVHHHPHQFYGYTGTVETIASPHTPLS